VTPAAPVPPATTVTSAATVAAGPLAGPATRPAPAAGPGGKHARAARPRRRRTAVAVIASVLAAATAVTAAGVLRHHPAQPQWTTVFNGDGTASVTGSGARQLITLQPERALTKATTHAALVISAARYRDFTATLTVRTVRQLRRGAAGPANPWEAGWVLWHYTSNQRFYALTLEPGGWVLSKQDPAYPGGERFLASGKTPGFALGIPHLVRIDQAGPRITVTADGRQLTQFTDTKRPYLGGALGLYCEDSRVTFSNIRITPLPALGQQR
jgi:hypothetical protein